MWSHCWGEVRWGVWNGCVSGCQNRNSKRRRRENVDDDVVMNDVGEMSSAVFWSVAVVQSVRCYGVGCAVPECDGGDVFGESGGPWSPAWQVLVVAVVVVVEL